MYKKLFVLITLLFLTPKTVSAKSVTLYKDQTVDKAYFEYGENIEIEGTVNGDVFLAGSKVNITGTINGDLFIAGDKIEIGGTVKGGVRAVGSTVMLKGQINDSVITFANKVEIQKEANISKDFIAGGQLITIDGMVGRDALIGSSNINLNGQINGNLTYYSGKEAQIGGSYSVLGQVQKKNFEGATSRINTQKPLNSFGNIFFSILSSLVVVFALNKFYPNKVNKLKKLALSNNDFIKTFVLGFLYLFAIPLIVLLLFLSFVGIYLGLIVIALYAIALHFAKIVFAYYLSNRIKPFEESSIYKPLILGLLVIEIIKYVPIGGFVVTMIATFWGLGTIINHIRFSKTK